MKDDSVILLEDDLGNTEEFFVMDVIRYEGLEYVVLLSNSEDTDEFVILRIDETDDGDEVYLGLDDDSLIDEVFEIFKKNHPDEFDYK